MRLFAVIAALLSVVPSIAHAQATPLNAPVLEPLTAQELEALRPLIDRGCAIVVRDPSAGPNARITAVARAHAPLAVIHDVIAQPERYPEFTSSVSNVEILSRFQNRVAVRMHTSIAIFTVDTVASMHMVNPRRIDGILTESQLGPGGYRWDLYPDGDNTIVSYTTWGDPSRGNWFLRQLARSGPAAIAGMEVSYNMMVVLFLSRRAENLIGRHLPGMPEHPTAASGTIAPPPPGPWMALAHDRVVAAITLNAAGEMTQSTVAMWVAAAPDAIRPRLVDVAHYTSFWPEIRSLDLGALQDGAQRFHTRVDSTLFHTEGDQDRVVEDSAQGPVVSWRGVSGDYANDTQRWDLVRAEGGGTVVMLSGGGDYNRAGLIMRNLIDRVPWMLPGYSAAWKMVWMQPLLHGL